MAFDLATAKPEEEQPTEFDLSTAQPEQQEIQPVPEEEPSFLESALGGLESAASIVSGAASIIPSGILGLAAAADPFGEEGAGGRIVERVQEALTYQPRTEVGQEEQMAVAEKLKPIGEAIANFEESVGAGALEATGSPHLAALAKALPAATAEILTLGAATPAVAATRQVVKRSVATGKEIAKKIPQSQTKQRIAKLIQEGVADVETARFKLKDPGVTTPAKPVKLQQAIADGAPKIVKDKVAIESIKQGFDEGVIAAIKGSTPADKLKMLKMVEIMEEGKKNKRFAVLNRPGDIAGDSLMDRFRSISKANKEAGAELNAVAKSLKNERVDQSPAVNQFIDDLDEIGVSLDNNLKPIFQGSDIEGVTAAENVIRKIVKRMKETRAPNAFDVHRLKKFIDEQVTFGKNAEGLAGTTERILKGLRRNLDEILDTNFDEYNRVNTVYSETRGAIDAFQDVAGKKTNLQGANADKAIGTLMRRVMSNAQSRVRLLDSINEIEKVAKKHGGGKQLKIEGPTLGKDDLLTQILFVDELDAVFGPVARTSFQGQIKQAVIPRTATDIAIKAGEKIIEKARGINEPSAFKSIKELLKETQ